MAGKQPKRKARPGMDEYGRTPLHLAVVERNLPRVRELLASGAHSSVQDDNGWTPLHFAAQDYLPDVAALLIQHGGAIDVQDSYGNSPLWRAVFCSQGRGELIAMLRRAGADPHLKNKSGVSPIELAHRIANYDVRQFFNDIEKPQSG